MRLLTRRHAMDRTGRWRNTPAAGDAIHAGISAKDAIVTVLTGAGRKSKAAQGGLHSAASDSIMHVCLRSRSGTFPRRRETSWLLVLLGRGGLCRSTCGRS